MGKETSQKKIESNRRNARKSTGPKTPEGKRAVRFNALKHGILAKEVVIEAGSGKESRAKFTELLTQLRQELQPEGILEEMQVERIAACYWRLRRAQRAEVGEIRKDLDTALFRGQIELLGPKAKYDEETQAFNKASIKELQARHGLISRIDELEKSRKEAGTGTAEHTEGTSVIEYDDIAQGPMALAKFATASIERMKRQIPLDGARKAKIKELRDAGYGESDVSTIEGLWESKREELKEFVERDQELRECTEVVMKSMTDLMGATLAREANLLRLSLPPKEAVDKILRYETAIERQLYRAINELERLQRRRRGDIVPPPIHVELSTE